MKRSLTWNKAISYFNRIHIIIDFTLQHFTAFVVAILTNSYISGFTRSITRSYLKSFSLCCQIWCPRKINALWEMSLLEAIVVVPIHSVVCKFTFENTIFELLSDQWNSFVVQIQYFLDFLDYIPDHLLDCSNYL